MERCGHDVFARATIHLFLAIQYGLAVGTALVAVSIDIDTAGLVLGSENGIVSARRDMKRLTQAPYLVDRGQCSSNDWIVDSGLQTYKAHFAIQADLVGNHQTICLRFPDRDMVAHQTQSGA